MGAGHCPWGGYADRIVCNIHGKERLTSRYRAMLRPVTFPNLAPFQPLWQPASTGKPFWMKPPVVLQHAAKSTSPDPLRS